MSFQERQRRTEAAPVYTDEIRPYDPAPRSQVIESIGDIDSLVLALESISKDVVIRLSPALRAPDTDAVKTVQYAAPECELTEMLAGIRNRLSRLIAHFQDVEARLQL